MPSDNAYDAVEYPSDAYRVTHPDRLACHGRLFGLATAEPRNCRYLELGCGAGINLLAMAVQLPESRFLGLDLAAAPIAEAQRHAAELGLTNVSFQQADIADAGAVAGEFDFIAAHGVFSWVPLEVRHALLALLNGHLSAHGVAYISYNAYPGCHIRQMVRQMLQYHVRSSSDPQQRREQSRSLMRFLLAAGIAPEPYATLLRSETERVVKAPMGLTIHDDLAEINQPYYFHEFITLAQQHHLQFLAESSLVDMSSLGVATTVRDSFKALDSDLLQKEQYLDFMRGRYFRQTLLCREECRLDRSDRSVHGVTSMLVTSAATIDPRGTQDVPGVCTYRRGDEMNITLSLPLANTLAQGIIAAWPAALSFSQIQTLLAQHHAHELPNREDLAGMIWDLAHTGLFELRLGQPPCSGVISERPCVSRFARWQSLTSSFVTSLHHETVALQGALQRVLLQLLDGTRTVPEASSEIAGLVAAGSLPRPIGAAMADAVTVQAAVANAVGTALLHFRQQALLER